MRRRTITALLLAVIAGCNPVPEDGTGVTDTANGTVVNLRFGGIPHFKSGGDDSETKISSLTLVVRPDVSGGWSYAVVRTLDMNELEEDGESRSYTTVLDLPSGDVAFSLFANLTPDMESFVAGASARGGLRTSRNMAYSVPEFSPVSDLGDYGEMAELLGEAFYSEDKGYVMSGTARAVVGTESNQEIDVDIVLHRMVARVGLSCKTYDGDPDYVVIDGYYDWDLSSIPEELRIDLPEDSGSQAGWVPLSSVRWFLDSVNSKVFLESAQNCCDPGENPDDPNMLLDDVLIQSGRETFYTSVYSGDFLHVGRESASQVFSLYSGDDLPWMSCAVADGDEPHWLLCPENTVASDTFLEGEDERSDYRMLAPEKAVTHLLVEARFIPRYVVAGRMRGEEWPRIYKSFGTMDDAVAALGGDGTFWTPDLKSFFTWQGVLDEIAYSRARHAEDPNVRELKEEDFICYPQGMCYYSTYVDGMKIQDGGSLGLEHVTYWDGLSSVRRDHSYNVVTSVMRVPSVSTSMIEMRTAVSYGWQDGYGNVTLKP